MEIKIEVAVRDAAEQQFINDCTAAIKKVVEEKSLDVQRICFARKSSYAGVRANHYHLYRRRSDLTKEIWINIKECSSDVNDAIRAMASGLYYWGIKEKKIAKTVSETAYTSTIIGGVSAPVIEAAPVQRERAAAPKVKKENKDIIVKKDGCTIRGFHEHKLTERNFIERLVAFTEKVMPVDNNFNDVKFSKRSAKLSRWTSEELKKNGFDASVGERVSGTVEEGKGKLSISFSFSRFDDYAFAMAVYQVMQMLKLDLDPVKALKPTEEEVTFEVLKTGVNSNDYAATVALNAYAAQVIG